VIHTKCKWCVHTYTVTVLILIAWCVQASCGPECEGQMQQQLQYLLSWIATVSAMLVGWSHYWSVWQRYRSNKYWLLSSSFGPVGQLHCCNTNSFFLSFFLSFHLSHSFFLSFFLSKCLLPLGRYFINLWGTVSKIFIPCPFQFHLCAVLYAIFLVKF